MLDNSSENPKYTFVKLDDESETIRCVEPYAFDYATFAKGRWLKRSLIDVMTKEFGGYEESYWMRAISNGLVTVNGKPTTPVYIIQNSDRIVHRTHRHEPPVKGKITLVGETEDLLAVSKPASMPMHPCGGYRYNSLSFILAHEPFSANQPKLHGVHRLDRVTSGLVILAKNKNTAAAVSKEIRENTTHKTYLARIRGRLGASISHLIQLGDDALFAPTESEEIKLALSTSQCDESQCLKKRQKGEDDNSKLKPKKKSKIFEHSVDSNCSTGSAAPQVDVGKSDQIGYGWCFINNNDSTSRQKRVQNITDSSVIDLQSYELVVRCPLAVSSYKEGEECYNVVCGDLDITRNMREGIHSCDVDGKPALSTFRSISYNEEDDTSLVYCKPHTGRTHQLRLHLQLIGNPIANDPCYGGQLFFGDPTKIANARELASRLRKRGGRTLGKIPHIFQLLDNDSCPTNITEEHTSTVDLEEKDGKESRGVISDSRRESESEDEFLIRNCRYCLEHKSPNSVEEATLHCDGIWLHALRYSGRNWQFETPFPSWATVCKSSQICA